MDVEPIVYRRCESPQDRAAIRRLFADERELSSYAGDVLDAPELVAWVALAGQEIVGAILTRPLRAEDGAELGGVDELLVAGRYQGHGIGRRLMELAEEHYRASSAAGVQLTVSADNAAARRLYESMGYATVQRRLRMRKRFREQ